MDDQTLARFRRAGINAEDACRIIADLGDRIREVLPNLSNLRQIRNPNGPWSYGLVTPVNLKPSRVAVSRRRSRRT